MTVEHEKLDNCLTSGRRWKLVIHADSKLYTSIIENEAIILWQPPEGHGAWIQVAQGELEIQGESLKKGDAIIIENESDINIVGISSSSEFLLFDLW